MSCPSSSKPYRYNGLAIVQEAWSWRVWMLGTFISNNKNMMKKYVCDVCEYEYDPAAGDPDNGIAPGTAFEDLPDDWVCPVCGVGKDQFSEA